MEKNNYIFRAYYNEVMNYNIIAGKFGAFYVYPGINNGLSPRLTPNGKSKISEDNFRLPENTPIMLYSGLRDTSDRLIFEGDLIKKRSCSKIFEIKFERGCLFATCDDEQSFLLRDVQISIPTVKKVGSHFPKYKRKSTFTDKAENDIYEGDIIELNKEIYEIKFNQGDFGFFQEDKTYKLLKDLDGYLFEIRVIGNKYTGIEK